MNFNLNVYIDEEQEKKAINERLSAKCQEIGDRIIHTLLADGTGFQRLKGPGYSIIQNYIEDKILGEGSKQIINDYIDANWERILQEATEKALQHKANGIAFQRIKE